MMKRIAALLLTLAVALCAALPVFAAGTIEVTEDVSVSDDYDWTRFKGQNVTLNVYNWGEYISNGSDDSVDVVAAFEKLTGIKVNYTTFDSNESMYAKLKSGAADYDVVIPSDYMVAKMIAEGMLKPLNYDNIPNFQKIDAEYRNPDYDPQNAYMDDLKPQPDKRPGEKPCGKAQNQVQQFTDLFHVRSLLIPGRCPWCGPWHTAHHS